MTSTQPQIARSSDGASSLVFSVQGRVVEHSTSQWRPEVFVAIPGMYPGCRVNLLNSISAFTATLRGHVRSNTSGQWAPSAVARFLLSLETAFAIAVCLRRLRLALLHVPRDRSSPSDMHAISTTTWCRSFPITLAIECLKRATLAEIHQGPRFQYCCAKTTSKDG